DDDVGPDHRTVLAHAPAFFLVPPVGLGIAQLVLGLALLNILLRVEAGKVLTDNLFGPIPLDALSADIPADHISPRVQHKNSIIGNPLNKQAKTLLALPQ